MATSTKLKEEELIFRKRLLYDGHGSENSNDDLTKLYNTISKDLSAAIHVADNNEKISKMCDKTFLNLARAIDEETQHLGKVKNDLVTLELELAYLEKLKKVNEFPNSSATEKTMEDIEKKKQQYIVRLERLKKKLGYLEESCMNLKKVLDDNEDDELHEQSDDCIEME